MRASVLALSALLLVTQGFERAHALQSQPMSNQLEGALSGPVSKRALERASSGERVNVIVMMRDDASQRDLRGLSDLRGEAAREALAHRQAEVLQDVFGVWGAAAPSGGNAISRQADHTSFPMTGAFSMRASASEIMALASHPEIEAVFEDSLSPPLLSDSTNVVGADQVWAEGNEGEGQVIVILDSGVSPDHVMTRDAIIASACFSSTVEGESTSLCDDQMDQLTSLRQVDLATPCTDSRLDPEAGARGCAHGTHVASIAAGRRSMSGEVLQGVAPQADILAVQVFSRFSQSACEEHYPGITTDCVLAYKSDQIEALEWVYSIRNQLNLASINMSLGGGEYDGFCTSDARRPIIQLLREAGILTVVAAGNSGFRGSLNAPACIPEVLSVGSVSNSGIVSGFSNASHDLDLFAPGERISAGLMTACPEETPDCQVFGALSGTSMAAPHVAGAIALLRRDNASASTDDIENALEFTGLQVSEAAGYPLAARMIQVDQALDVVESNGLVIDGVRLRDPRIYVATNTSEARNSFNTERYAFKNESNAYALVDVVSAPDWIQTNWDSRHLPVNRIEFLELSVDLSKNLLGADSGVVRIQLNGDEDQEIEIPVFLRVQGDLEIYASTVEAGPWALTGDRHESIASIFRVVGLATTAPYKINVAIAGATEGEFSNTFEDCSLTPDPRRYSGSEYLIVAADLAECGDFGQARLRFQFYVHPDDAESGLTIRRFYLDGMGALSDEQSDRQFSRLEVTSTNLEGVELQGGVALEGSFDVVSSEEDTNFITSSLRFDWVEESRLSRFQHEFWIQGLEAVQLRRFAVRILYEAEGSEGSEGVRWCYPSIRADRWVGPQYRMLVDDIVEACGPFGRADLSLQVDYRGNANEDARAVSVRRIVRDPLGGISDHISQLYYETQENVSEDPEVAEMHFGPFQWTGDQSAPTQSVFRLVGLRRGMPTSIDVSVNHASQGDYSGTFDDCSVPLVERRASNWDYLIYSTDLVDCGEFGRADLTFRVRFDPTQMADNISGNAEVRMRRVAVGAEGDLTDFAFDADRNNVDRPAYFHDGNGNLGRVTFGTFEWVGDDNAGTRSVFRMTGLTGLPEQILVAVKDSTNPVRQYENAFTDCELEPKPERMDGSAYLITPQDIAACGDFGRADLSFRIVIDVDDWNTRYTMRRFAVTQTGGLTDFWSDATNQRYQ